MTKTVGKPIKVTVNIQIGPGTPSHKQAWKRFWGRIAQVQDGVKANER